MRRMGMTCSWELLKSKKTEPGKISVSSIDDLTENWDIFRIINHEKKIGLRVGCHSLNIENNIFKKKLPKLTQIKITWNTINSPFLIIQLQDDSFEDQFIKFIEIIIDKIKDSKDEELLIKTVINECFKWSLFLMPDKERKLKIQKQKGLIAELLFLQKIFNYLDFTSALNAWTGPDKFSKDFILNNNGFEIKSIQTGNKNKVSISNHDQLDLIGLNKLFLITYLLSSGSRDNNKSFTLTELVKEIRKKLDFDQDSKFIFENKLTMAGYSDLDDYSDSHFIKTDRPSFYEVSEKFPSITRGKIDISSIIRVNYDLDITKLEEYKVEESIVIKNIEKNEKTSHINHEKLEEKIEHGETKLIEFKQSLSLDIKQIANNKNYSPKKEKYLNEVIMKTLNAFLNTDGGELFIGIQDDPIQITGIEKEIKILYKSSTDNILKHIGDLIEDFIGSQYINLIDYEIKQMENKKIIHFVCKKSNKPVYLKETGFFIRNGPSTRELKGRALSEYIKERFK